MARKKTTIYLEPDLLTATETLAASSGRREYEVIEDALHDGDLTSMERGRTRTLRLLSTRASRCGASQRGPRACNCFIRPTGRP
jgi:hypothetical protein